MTYAVPVKVAIAFLIAAGKVNAAKRWHDALTASYVVTGVLLFGVDEAELTDAPEPGMMAEFDLTMFPKLAPGYPVSDASCADCAVTRYMHTPAVY
jgi:hypothetical protein